MIEKGFTGISYPFRIGVKGGVVLSTTSSDDDTHIVEAMQQIVQTFPLERCMEYHFKTEVSTSIFDSNDISTHTLIAYELEKALTELEDRVEITEIVVWGKNSEVYATIYYKVLQFNATRQVVIKVGESQQ